jgi:ATP-dependent helicase/nuclease subunit B
MASPHASPTDESNGTPAALGEAALIARLAEGDVEAGGPRDAEPPQRITVITPNARLAASLLAEFNRHQVSRGLAAWRTPDILPFNAFVERLHEDALYSARAASGAGIAALLGPAEEQHLWQDIIEQSPWGGQLLSGAQAAAQCRNSWQLAHAWRIAGAIVDAGDGDSAWLSDLQGEDARAFTQWARAYVARTARAGCTDRARLPDLVAALLTDGRSDARAVEALARPDVLFVHAFDMVTAQQRAFFDACRQAGTEVLHSTPDPQSSHVVRVPFEAAKTELEHAARWARHRLEAWRQATGPAGARDRATPRIAVVVPDLEARRKEVVRVFARALDPGWRVPTGAASDPGGGPAGGQSAPLFNVSLGVPLSDWPVVDAALAVLELASGELEFHRASRLLRSPFITGADAELGARAAVDAALRERVPPRLRLPALLSAVRHVTDPDGHRPAPACPRLVTALERLLEMARAQLPGGRSPQEWARRYSELLAAVGFPGERVADSAEFQTLAKWRETLGELAQIERVAPRMTHAQALARLRRLCADTLFQPRLAADGGDAPIQVLGILESGGLGFDHLWVSGLTEQAWPLTARPDPFIPLALQKKAGIPQSLAESALELDERITREWCRAAGEVVFSHPLAEADVQLLPSPLIAQVPPTDTASLGLPAETTFRDRLFRAGRDARERFVDEVAPRFPHAEARGGTRVLADQAACGFRALARHRLLAEPLATPVAGLDAASRGQLLHALFAHIWAALKTKVALEAATGEELEALIASAADRAVAKLRAQWPDIIGDNYAALERSRLSRLARDWLALERSRPDFEVIAREDARELIAGSLKLRGRIDRMDRFADGTHALIDYKTGRTSTAAWLGERPDDPQLPLYAVNAGERIAAVAFARLRTGDMRFDGIARDKDLLPGVPAVEGHRRASALATDWAALLAGWRAEVDALAEAFVAGDARVDPKVPGKSCEHCGLQPLCRVHERFDALATAGEAGASTGDGQWGDGADAMDAADGGGVPT